MGPLEIALIAACVAVVGGVVTSTIIKKKKGKGSCGGDCGCCSCGCSSQVKKSDSSK